MTSAPRGHTLAVATAAVFVISSVFPVVAGLSRNTETFPRLWGVLDVVIAFLLATLVILVAARFERVVTDDIRLAAYRAYRALINVILVLLVVFFLAGDRVTWVNCLTGFAWRVWLMFYALPPWLAAFRSNQQAVPAGGNRTQTQ